MTQAGIARIIGKSPSFVYRSARGEATFSVQDVIKLTGSIKEPLSNKLHDIVRDIPNKISWLSNKLVATGKKVTAVGKKARRKIGRHLRELGEHLESLNSER